MAKSRPPQLPRNWTDSVHQPLKHIFTNKQSVVRNFYLWKRTLMQHDHSAKSHRVAKQHSTTEHAYTKKKLRRSNYIVQSHQEMWKPKARECKLQPESLGRSRVEPLRAQVDHENAPAAPWCSSSTPQRLTELQEKMEWREV
jgi:hypothetical protein